MPIKHQSIAGSILIALLLFSTWVYWPGLSGGFMLDDETNLYRLDMLNTNASVENLRYYIIDGLSSNLGRPVSLLSFAAQYYSWPTNPGSFKYVNLMIHLLNGILVFLLARLLFNYVLQQRSWSQYLALAVAAIWILHPLQISTVLYVVQRMTQLSALFMLLGMVLYFHGRLRYYDSRKTKAFVYMSLGVAIGGILGVLSKENAILLPLYIIVVEVTLLRRVVRDKHYHYWAGVFLYAPLVLFTAFLLYGTPGFLEVYKLRDFTLAERIMTEARILFDYLGKMFIIQPKAYGLFHDDYTISRSLLQPWTTLPALLGIVGMLAGAIIWRKKYPVAAFAVLWFMTSHAIESTYIPLELYFEHRNYVALMGPVFLVLYGVYHLYQHLDSALIKNAALGATALWAMLVVFITFQDTKVWGDLVLQAQIWGQEKPYSKRAQAARVTSQALAGDYAGATQTLAKLAERYPKDAAIYFAIIQIRCIDPNIGSASRDHLLQKLKHANSSFTAISTLGKVILFKEQGICKSMPDAYMTAMFKVLMNNERFAYHKSDVHFLYARYLLSENRYQDSLTHLKLSYDVAPRTMVKLYQIHVLTRLKQYTQALQHVEIAKKHLAGHFKERMLYEKKIAAWEQVLNKLIRKQPTKTSRNTHAH